MVPESGFKLKALPAEGFLFDVDAVARQDYRNDLDEDSLGRRWEISFAQNEVSICRLDDAQSRQVLFTASGLVEVSFAFDPVDRVVAAYASQTQGSIWWFDSSVQQTVSLPVPGATSLYVVRDDRRPGQAQRASVLVCYLTPDHVCYRAQDDRFMVERIIMSKPPDVNRIISGGMNTQRRVQVILGRDLG